MGGWAKILRQHGHAHGRQGKPTTGHLTYGYPRLPTSVSGPRGVLELQSHSAVDCTWENAKWHLPRKCHEMSSGSQPKAIKSRNSNHSSEPRYGFKSELLNTRIISPVSVCLPII